MHPQWYCSIDSQQYGPLPFEQLQQWAAEGRLQPGHHICIVGQQQWQVAGNVPGLFAPAHSYPQQPAAESGFNFGGGSVAPSSTTSRTPSKPKNNINTFRWGTALLMGTLAAFGGAARMIKLNENNQKAAQQRQQEVRRQQKINTPPPLPPITSPKVDMKRIDAEIKKARNRRP